jgi:hypothetical protein
MPVPTSAPRSLRLGALPGYHACHPGPDIAGRIGTCSSVQRSILAQEGHTSQVETPEGKVTRMKPDLGPRIRKSVPLLVPLRDPVVSTRRAQYKDNPVLSPSSYIPAVLSFTAWRRSAAAACRSRVRLLRHLVSRSGRLPRTSRLSATSTVFPMGTAPRSKTLQREGERSLKEGGSPCRRSPVQYGGCRRGGLPGTSLATKHPNRLPTPSGSPRPSNVRWPSGVLLTMPEQPASLRPGTGFLVPGETALIVPRCGETTVAVAVLWGIADQKAGELASLASCS